VEALNEVLIAIELWLETAVKVGREIPSPLGKVLLAELAASQTAGI
jgi:predicted RNase H-like HicB family nuclease